MVHLAGQAEGRYLGDSSGFNPGYTKKSTPGKDTSRLRVFSAPTLYLHPFPWFGPFWEPVATPPPPLNPPPPQKNTIPFTQTPPRTLTGPNCMGPRLPKGWRPTREGHLEPWLPPRRSVSDKVGPCVPSQTCPNHPHQQQSSQNGHLLLDDDLPVFIIIMESTDEHETQHSMLRSQRWYSGYSSDLSMSCHTCLVSHHLVGRLPHLGDTQLLAWLGLSPSV